MSDLDPQMLAAWREAAEQRVAEAPGTSYGVEAARIIALLDALAAAEQELRIEQGRARDAEWEVVDLWGQQVKSDRRVEHVKALIARIKEHKEKSQMWASLAEEVSDRADRAEATLRRVTVRADEIGSAGLTHPNDDVAQALTCASKAVRAAIEGDGQ